MTDERLRDQARALARDYPSGLPLRVALDAEPMWQRTGEALPRPIEDVRRAHLGRIAHLVRTIGNPSDITGWVPSEDWLGPCPTCPPAAGCFLTIGVLSRSQRLVVAAAVGGVFANHYRPMQCTHFHRGLRYTTPLALVEFTRLESAPIIVRAWFRGVAASVEPHMRKLWRYDDEGLPYFVMRPVYLGATAEDAFRIGRNAANLNAGDAGDV